MMILKWLLFLKHGLNPIPVMFFHGVPTFDSPMIRSPWWNISRTRGAVRGALLVQVHSNGLIAAALGEPTSLWGKQNVISSRSMCFHVHPKKQDNT